MPPRYLKALDVQLDLIRFWKGEYGPLIGDYWVDFLIGKDATGLQMDYGAGHLFARREAESLNQAATYWVAPPMVDLLDSVRHTMPSYELRANDIPSRNGFAYLGRPLYMIDIHGKRCNITAFSWAIEPLIIAVRDEKGGKVHPPPLTEQEIEQAFEMDFIPIPEDKQLTAEEVQMMADSPFSTPVVRRADGSMLAKTVRFFVYSDKRDPNDDGWGGGRDEENRINVEAVKDMINCQWSLYHVDSWMLNQMLPDDDDPQLRGTDSFLRIVAAFWTMCNQKVTWTGGMGLDRHTRKRAARGMNPVPPDVKVVTLRRMVGQPRYDGDGEPMHYSHSFWVGKETGGFLRNQWYPSEGRHKPLWIAPFIKGDGPLIDKDTVYDVRR